MIVNHGVYFIDKTLTHFRGAGTIDHIHENNNTQQIFLNLIIEHLLHGFPPTGIGTPPIIIGRHNVPRAEGKSGRIQVMNHLIGT